MGSFILEQSITPDDDEELQREEAERNEEIMQLISAELKPFSDDELNDSDDACEDSFSEADASSVSHETNRLYKEETKLVQQLDAWMAEEDRQPDVRQTINSARNRRFVSDSESEQLQYDQLEVLYRAQGRQIKQLQQAVQEGEKKVRILNHQLVTSRMELEQKDAKCRESLERWHNEQKQSSELQRNIESLKAQLDSLTLARDNALADLRLSETTVDSLQSQLNEMSRSETLGRVRRQQEEAMAAVEQRHEKEKLTLTLELDRVNEALAVRCDEVDRLREELEGAVCHAEEERMRNGDMINKLTASLQESQMRCQQLLEEGPSRQLTDFKLQLQQVTTAYQEAQAECDSLKHHSHDLERQLQRIDAEKQHFSDQLNNTMAQLNIAHQNHPQDRLIDPDVTHLRLDLDKAIEENEKKKQLIDELQSQLVSLQRIIEGERSKNCKAEGRVQHLEVTDAHLKEARKQQSELKETVARLTGELKKQAKQFEEDKKTSLEKCRQACLQLHNSSSERLRRTKEEQHQQQVAAVRLQLTAQEKELKHWKERCEELETKDAEKEKRDQKRMEDELNEMRIQVQNETSLSLQKERETLISENTTNLALVRAEWLREKDEQVRSEVCSAVRVAESEWKVEQREQQKMAVEKAVSECDKRWRQQLKETEVAAKLSEEEVEMKVKIAQEEAQQQYELETSQLKSEHQTELERARQDSETATQRAIAVAEGKLRELYEVKLRQLQQAVVAGKLERRKWDEERARMIEKQKRLDTAYRASVHSLTQRYELERDQIQLQRRREMISVATQASQVSEVEQRLRVKQYYERSIQCMKSDMMQYVQRVQEAAQRQMETRIARERHRAVEEMKKRYSELIRTQRAK